MLFQQERELVQAYGLKMLEKGLTTGIVGQYQRFQPQRRPVRHEPIVYGLS
ncbi:MAG: hypothetical protein ACLT0Y_05445 [Christensenellales bacterium]